jgi:hypothetical protein
MADRTCSVKECDRPAKRGRAGMCEGHYSRVRDWGDPRGHVPLRRREPNPSQCVMDDCERSPIARGLCPMHYHRWERLGDPSVTLHADQRSYSAMHMWIRSQRGQARDHQCVDCSAPADDWSYDHADPDEVFDERGFTYSRKVEHYAPRCKPCHRRFDRGR